MQSCISESQEIVDINQLSHFMFKETDTPSVTWLAAGHRETDLKLDSRPSASYAVVIFPIHHSASGRFQLAGSYKSFDVVNEWTFS